ncbi:glycosyltransferase [Schleiferiaceae bacterium]|nr:glycosyltransferase [Schleiferiaceae bacterium]
MRQDHKLLLVAPSLKLGGIERALTNLSYEFVEQGLETSYISCLKAEHFYTVPKEVNLLEPSFRRQGGIFNKILFYPRLLWFIRKSVRQINPKAVLVYGDWFSPITLLALSGLKIPVYISDRTIPDYPFKFPIPQLKKWLYPKSAGFIAQTTRAKNYKEKIFGNSLNIRVIPNALPLLNNTSASMANDELSLLYMGRFAWEKDPEILIRALPRILKVYPEIKLRMAGDGPLLTVMKQLVQNLELESSVVFLGKVTDVSHSYYNCSVFVLPSVIEGFPNALIEAMSFGLPVVCFSDIPFEDIVTNGIDGVVVQERSSEALANEIIRLIGSEELRNNLGRRAILSVERFDLKNIASQTLNFIELQ